MRKNDIQDFIKDASKHAFRIFSPFIIYFILHIFFRESSVWFTFLIAILPLALGIKIAETILPFKKAIKFIIYVSTFILIVLYIILFTSLAFWGIFFYLMGAFYHAYLYGKMIEDSDW